MRSRPRRAPLVPRWLVISGIACLAVAVVAVIGVILASRTSQVIVPAVVGLREPDAINRLQEAGLVAVYGGTLFSNDAPRGTVLSQDPAAGSSAHKGDEVRIVLSAGAETFVMPDVIGLSAEEAHRQLTEVGLSVTTQVVESTLASGTVLESFPAPGSEVRPGTPVRLSIAGTPPGSTSLTQYSFVGVTLLIDPVPRQTTPDVTAEIARRVRAFVEASGGTAVVTRSASTTSTALSERVAMATQTTPTAAIVLDVASTGAGGMTVSITPSKQTSVNRISSSIASAAVDALSSVGLTARDGGSVRDPILSVAQAPGIRLVLGSLSDSADVGRFGDPSWADSVARAIYRALGAGLGRDAR